MNRDYDIKIGTEFAIRILQKHDTIHCGKISRKRIFEKHEKTPSDITDVKEENWPYLLFVCDTSSDRQLLIIEYKISFGYKITKLTEILAELSNQRLYNNGYAATFEPIVGKETFWNIIAGSDGVFALTFNLVSPNLFGASSNANDALKKMQELFNNNRAAVSLYNDKGKLKIPKERVESYREYADGGGGNWKITVQTKKKRKRTYKSAERALKITVETEDGESIEILKAALLQFLDKI
ncbi:hypothetical protein ES705_19067 [subsurface metagenome]